MKQISLGSAAWGWSMTRDVVFEVLDGYYASGGRRIDCARNYPINGDDKCFSLAARYLAEWCELRGAADAHVTFKVGSISNRKIPDNRLDRRFLLSEFESAIELFDSRLRCLMIHWDNRNSLDEILETLSMLDTLRESGVTLGLSGIRYPDLYREAFEQIAPGRLDIQVKHNVLESVSDAYAPLDKFHPDFWAYGIAAGGAKLGGETTVGPSFASVAGRAAAHERFQSSTVAKVVRSIVDNHSVINSFYRFSMAYAETSEALAGYIVAPSNADQLRDIVDFRRALGENEKDILDSVNWQSLGTARVGPADQDQ